MARTTIDYAMRDTKECSPWIWRLWDVSWAYSLKEYFEFWTILVKMEMVMYRSQVAMTGGW